MFYVIYRLFSVSSVKLWLDLNYETRAVLAVLTLPDD